MSFMQVSASKWDGIEVKYREAFQSNGYSIAASVDVRLDTDRSDARLSLSIEDARTLAEQLPRILMEHDAAERLAAEKAVA
ncbi:hypothetical protein NONO_c24640 [Nocardia nova SH22a]|uniref:Uncharacterized protein n=1 Tax=Nocardia nova SH22a TaxID=1415166 RepID=W5TD45_9NOCA|nr:hypothetical protein [Nocardia nova]AHH17260.1 hypothetical protein NONO_c24640 [Nocardia nova SH22a]